MKALTLALAILMSVPAVVAHDFEKTTCFVGDQEDWQETHVCTQQKQYESTSFTYWNWCLGSRVESNTTLLTSGCVSHSDYADTEDPDTRHKYVRACVFNNVVYEVLHYAAYQSLCRSVKYSGGDEVESAYHMVDGDEDLIPTSVEWNLCGRYHVSQAVNSTLVPGHCEARWDYDADA